MRFNLLIADIKEKVRAAQYEALKAVNIHLTRLYWEYATKWLNINNRECNSR